MIFGIVLAAGMGRRIGTPKALLSLSGETFHQRAIRVFREARLPCLVVVSGLVNAALPPPVRGEERVLNPDPDQDGGMFSSVKLGLAEAIVLGAEGVILLPVDHPLVTTGDLRSVVAQLRNKAAIVVATYGGRRGHPIGIDRGIMDEITLDPSLATLRDVVHRDPRRVVEVAVSEGAILGINTKEDLERASNRPFR